MNKKNKLFGISLTLLLMAGITSCGKTTSFNIVWKNADGTVIKEENVSSLEDLKFDGENPIKANTAEYTYSFDGWDKKEEDGQYIYVAKFSATKNKYDITFKNEDGTILSTKKLEYGTKASDVEVPSNPTKDATSEFSYTFAGWDKEISDVTGDATYTATYTSSKNSYNVTFKDEDGTILKEAKAYEYGTKASDIEKPENPTKAYETEYSYAFSGWDKEISDVTGDVTYTATYEAILNRYNVIFLDEDGETVLKEGEFYYYGTLASDIELPATPTKESTVEKDYVFAGWDKEISNVNGNAAYIATYKESPRKYTITFKNADGTVLSEAKYNYGTLPADIVIPTATVASTQAYSYEFKGWDKEISNVTGDATYKAEFNTIVNKYNVTFVDEDGTVLKEAKSYDYGTLASNIEKPEEPTKEKTAEFSYQFAGWDKEISNVTGNVVYKATYNATKNKYWISFVNYDGTPLIAEAQYEYGTLPKDIVMPDFTPIREAEVDTVYTFKDWDSELKTVTGDFTYVARYNEAPRKYTVIFKNEYGTVLSEAQYNYGTLVNNITAPTPTKAKTQAYTYEFAGWDNEISNVTGDAIYQAKFNAIINKYNVTFVDEDGTVLKEAKAYDYGTLASNIELPENPTKEKTQAYTYTFAGWDNEVAEVKDDIVYTATYSAKLNIYAVFFKDYNGDTLRGQGYEYGTLAGSIIVPSGMSKPSTPEYDYEFTGWDKEIVDVTEDITYTATYKEILRSYNATLSQTIAAAGNVTSINSSYLVHSKIQLEAELIGNYSFLGWYDGEDLISEELKCEYEMPTNDINIIVKFADLRLTIKSGEGGKKSGYYVTYDLNYEDAEAGEVIFVEEGMQVPYKTVYRSAESGVQYDFMYWCLDAEGTKIFDEDTPIREDMTIYAKWFNNTVVNYADILKPSSAVSTRTSNIKPGTYGSTYYYFATKDTTITFNYMSTSSGGFKLELTNMTQNKTLANWYHNPSGVDDYHAMNIQVKKGDILKFDFKRGKGYGCYARFYLDNLPLTPTGLGVVLGYDNEMVQSGTKITVSAEPIMYEEEYDKDTYYYNVKENGYTFIGWYDGDTLVSTDHVFTFIMPKKSVTYEPKYVKSTVVVEKDLKIASVSVGKCYVGEKTTIEAKPEYGHTFLGWFDKNNNLLTRELKLDVDVTLTETTYVAKYSSRYTIQTNADSQQVFGNVGVDPTFTQKTAIVPTVGTKVTLYASPYKNTFLGWYRNDEFYSLDTTIEVVATDEIVSYNALFRMNVYVYVDNDSSIYGWGSAEIIGDMLYVGDKVKLKATPSDNCEFTGWYLDGNLVSEDPEIEVEVTTDIQRFYAHFERKTS